MADPTFFENHGPHSLKDIAEKTDCAYDGPDNISIKDVAPLDQAGQDDLSFLDNLKYKDAFEGTKAGAVIISKKMQEFAPKGAVLLLSDNPYKSYALAAQLFYPDNFPPACVSDRAEIASSVQIGEGVIIEPFAIIEDGVKIGAGSWIGPNAHIGKNVEIGRKCRIGSGASISHALIGDAVRLYPGVRIGQDGFGFAIDPAGHVKVPQLGRVIIEDHVEIGANSTIDRGAGPDTVIGAGSWIDNLVQIGHNVKIGKGCILVAQSGVAGSTTLEDYAVLAAQAGVAGHLTIGSGARIAAQTGVMRDIEPGTEHMGYPSVPIKEFMRQVATLKRLTKSGKSE